MEEILNAIVVAGGEPIRIGGCIRDKLLGLKCKDVDIEVYGLAADELCEVLTHFGKVDVVGESFGVIKLTTEKDDFDFSLPRRDNKVGRGHKGFQVEVDHSMTPQEAALRRDFTMNAIGETLAGELLDPYGGVRDLQDRILRATSEHFSEDPLRVLRGFQFAARFELTADDRTLEMCRALVDEADTLAIERIWGEWVKWGTKGLKPSHGLRFLVDSGWIELFPELGNLIGVPQDPVWHPEGCAWSHTLHVCDAAARLCDRDGIEGDDRLTIILAALCHDLGKALPENGGTTVFETGHWRSQGHADAGVPLSLRFLRRIGCHDRIIDKVLPLVAEHMICVTTGEVNDRLVRRLTVRLGKASMKELLLVMEADHSGRPPLPCGIPESALQMLEIAERLNIEAAMPQPIIRGRHLIALGLKPGPHFGKSICQCYEAQLDGSFADEEGALVYLAAILGVHLV